MGFSSAALAVLVTAMSATGASTLADGVARYQTQDYGGALASLSRSLTFKITPKQRAKAHVYLGMIQFQYERAKDARRSFAEALEHNSSVRLPAGAPRDARLMFKKAKRKHTKRSQRAKRRLKQRKAAATASDPPASTEPTTVDPTKPPPDTVAVAAPPPPSSTLLQPPPTASDVRAATPPPPAPASDPAATATPPPPAAPPPPPPEPPPLVVTEPESSGPNVAAWSLVGVGLASAVVGGVFAGLASKAQSRADFERANDGFAFDYIDAINDRNRNMAVSITGFSAAAVSAGIGAILFATD